MISSCGLFAPVGEGSPLRGRGRFLAGRKRGAFARCAGRAHPFVQGASFRAGRTVLLHLRRRCGVFFPTRGKEPKGDQGQPSCACVMAAPGPLPAWRVGATSCRARLMASSRGRLGAALGAMQVVPRRSGGTDGPPSLRAGDALLLLKHGPEVLASVGRASCGDTLLLGSACGLTGRTRCGAATPPQGRRSRSILRRPPQEVATSLNRGGARKHGRSGATVGEPRPSSRNQGPLPQRGRCHGASRDG